LTHPSFEPTKYFKQFDLPGQNIDNGDCCLVLIALEDGLELIFENLPLKRANRFMEGPLTASLRSKYYFKLL